MSDGAGLVFLTGATGFIGGRLAAALHARGHRLRCLVRSPERAVALKALGAELIVGDVSDESAMKLGLGDARLAYHIAGAYDIGVVDVGAMQRANVAGTQAFVSAVVRSGVERAVYVSTTAVLEPAASGRTEGDADSPMRAPFPTVYQETKARGHAIAVAAQRAGAPVTIACPAYVYGPGDTGPAARYVMDVLRHRIPGLSTRPAWFSYVHVDDVVDGLVAAGERGAAGATYVLSGEAASVNDFTRRVVELAGTWGPPLRFPPVIVTLTGSVLDMISRVAHVRLPISREIARLAATGVRYVHSYEGAAADLGYAPRSLSAGLPETVKDIQQRLRAPA